MCKKFIRGNIYERKLGGCQEKLRMPSDHDAGLTLSEGKMTGRKQVRVDTS